MYNLGGPKSKHKVSDHTCRSGFGRKIIERGGVRTEQEHSELTYKINRNGSTLPHHAN
jgi:hypothetical protein